MEKLVSIIMPAFNCENYIGESIESVISQTYCNWELIIVDDCSTDNTSKVIENYLSDKRVKYFFLDHNIGAAGSRQRAVNESNGYFLAFLDSDDLWFSNKLKVQIDFMEKNQIKFCATDYLVKDEVGNKDILISYKKNSMTYDDLLKDCPGNSTIIIDNSFFNEVNIFSINKRNDYLLWLQLIHKSIVIEWYHETLSIYRKRTNSISSNKFSLIKYHWEIYYSIERLGFFKSLNLCFYWIYKGILKVLGI